ncbi:hypothetical protein BKA62DRAFT_769970 [Auriculariales sp. MPI-PUGE-AT-0066]|nr:hypothetical protein BKA62DRAFT_769970 [Auriculariales sp. MPI-PUGE-AT-0066]
MRRFVQHAHLLSRARTKALPYDRRRWLHVSPAARNESSQRPPHNAVRQESPPHMQVDLPVNVPGPGSVGPAPNTGGAVGAGFGSPMPFPAGAPWDAALTTLIGLGIVFLGGVGYVAWYKRHVLSKIEEAFAAGSDPALELAKFGAKKGTLEIEHLRRKEQDLLDSIIAGKKTGHYYVLLGSKGCGKGSIILDAMREVDAEGVVKLFRATTSADNTVSRRLCHPRPSSRHRGRPAADRKSNHFEYYEDSQTGLFQRRDPREAGPALDIERALNKLEKVALRYAKRKGRPVVMIFNNAHLVGNTEDGRNVLLQLQQRAESWSECGIGTCIFVTDDSWVYFSMKRTANRAQFLTIADLTAREAFSALQRLRRTKTVVGEVLEHVLDDYHDVIQYTGGRLSLLNKVARSHDMKSSAHDLLTVEKGWLRSRIGLIEDCDDDVMDEASSKLLKNGRPVRGCCCTEFVKARIQQEEEFALKVESGEVDQIEAALQYLPLPTIPYWQAHLDTMNIISVDTHYNVRPDSMLILRAAREVVEEEGFEDKLNNVRDRIDAIESLHRTRELTLKRKGSEGSTWLWPFI